MKTMMACIATATITAVTAGAATGITNIYQGGEAHFVGKATDCQSVARRVGCLVYYRGSFGEVKYTVTLAHDCITVGKWAFGGAAQHLQWRRREC
jgi:hypothetical protein